MIETPIGTLTADECGQLADYNCQLAAEYSKLAEDPEVPGDLRAKARALARWRRTRYRFFQAETAATEAYEAAETRSTPEIPEPMLLESTCPPHLTGAFPFIRPLRMQTQDMTIWNDLANHGEHHVFHPLGCRCRGCGYITEPDPDYVVCVPLGLRCVSCGLTLPEPPLVLRGGEPLAQVYEHFEPLVWREG